MNMEPPSKILDRIRKLLRLANDPSSPAEAALAAARAQALMFEHSINEAALEMDGGPAQAAIGEEEIDASPQRTTWKARLASHLCASNFCHLYTTTRRGVTSTMLIGRPDATATVRYLYAYLVNESERLARRDGIRGRTALNNYRLGVVNVIGYRLRDQRAHDMHASANSKALVLVNREEAALKLYEKQKHPRMTLTRPARATMDENARMAGERAGREVNLDGGGQRLGSTAKKLEAAR